MIAKRMFGQNFLRDKKVASKIVSAAEIRKGDQVWEIGPGKGILTEQLLAEDCNLTCFEIDRDIIPLLKNKFGNRINLINEDILKTDWDKYINASKLRVEENGTYTSEKTDNKITLVANIPYNITSPLLTKLCYYSNFFRVVVLMLQKEVAERIASPPKRKSYGVLSLKMQYYFDISRVLKVPAHKFKPKPNVDSMVVKLTPRTKENNIQPPSAVKGSGDFFWKIVETAFQSRRKTLKNNLKSILSPKELQALEKLLASNTPLRAFSNQPELHNYLNKKEHKTASKHTADNNKKTVAKEIKNKVKVSRAGKENKLTGDEAVGFDLTSRGEDLSEKDFIYLYHAILAVRSKLIGK